MKSKCGMALNYYDNPLALELSMQNTTLYVGSSMDISCSTHLEVAKMEWLMVGMAEPVEQREDGDQNLTLVLNPTDTELNGVNYTCRVTTKAGNVFQDFFTLEVKGKCGSLINYVPKRFTCACIPSKFYTHCQY